MEPSAFKTGTIGAAQSENLQYLSPLINLSNSWSTL